MGMIRLLEPMCIFTFSVCRFDYFSWSLGALRDAKSDARERGGRASRDMERERQRAEGRGEGKIRPSEAPDADITGKALI